jgi:hypothetical protein
MFLPWRALQAGEHLEKRKSWFTARDNVMSPVLNLRQSTRELTPK